MTMDTCRLCSTSRSHKDLSKIDNKKLEIQKKLRETFNIELTSSQDPANNFCCRICVKNLNNSHSFYLQIVESQKKFETVNFEFSSVDVKVEKFEDKSVNFCGDIKLEKEENIVDDFGDSYDAGTYNDESNDFGVDNDDEFELMEANEDHSLKISSAGRLIDLSYLYNDFEAPQVKAALSEMGFERLKYLFEEQKIDFEVFKSLNQADFYEILRNYPIGIRKKVHQSYEIWQKSYLSEDHQAVSRAVLQLQSTSKTPPNAQQSSSDGPETLTIAYILNHTEAGILFKKHSNGQSTLLKKEKRKLTEIIVNYFITRKTKLAKPDFKRLADEIRQLFPQELSETYFCDDVKPSGMLYSKYHNTLRTFRKNDQMECMTKKRKLEHELSNEDEKEEVTFSTEENYSDEYVRTNSNGKFDKLNLHWKISSKCRKYKIVGMESNLSEIFSEYSAYTRTDGYMLLNTDFQLCHSTNNFKEKWLSMAPMLLEILLANISNQFVKSKLTQYRDLSETARVVALLLGLHVFLYESGKWRPSILESFRFMVLIVKNESTQESEMNEWKQKLKDSNYNFLPTIIAYGDNFENFEDKFLVCFNGNYYFFNNIFKALEVLINMFMYFNITLPPPNRNVFKFLMAKIYDHSEDLNASDLLRPYQPTITTTKPKSSKKKTTKTTKKSKKSTKSIKVSIKQEDNPTPAPKEDFLDIIYKNENEGKFSDNFLQLGLHQNEMKTDGRLVPEAELQYSALKWSNYLWKCKENCEGKFDNIVDLNLHLKAVHKSRYKSFCNQCGITCSNFPSFVTHTIKYHNTNARFSCIICSTIFWNLNDLFKHYKADHQHRILMCLYCGLHFNTLPVLKIHLIQNHKHDDKRDILICDICNLKTKTRQNMIEHMKSHTTSTRLICDQCGAVFNRRAVLESHVSHIHKNKDALAKCHCGKSFKNFERLRRHKKIVHEKHLTPHNYECPFCHKKYRTNHQLKCHLYSHDQNSARYQCPHCDKTFRYSSGFQYHVRSTHTMEKPYGCPCCDKTYFDNANAAKHVKSAHGGDFKPIRLS